MVRALSKNKQENIKSLVLQNKPYSVIMERIPNLKKSTLSRYANKFSPGRVTANPGRKAVLSVTTKSYIRKQIINGTLKTAKAVHKYLVCTGHTISYSGTIKVMKSMNFHAKIKVKKPLLTKVQKARRLAWAEEHKNWTSDDWRRMVFSDETKVNVYGSDGCKYYWSRPDDKLQPHHLDLTVKGGGGSIMVWGCITYDGPGYACWISEGTMKASDYVGILGTTLMDSLEYYGYHPQDIYFQQDNDPKHTSKLAKQWFKDNNFKCDHTFNWPSQSPDLNPIEHIWHHLKLKLSAYDTRAKGVHELWNRVEKEWSTFTAEDCRRYIDSMPDRCRAVIAAKGGHTRY